MTNTSLRFFETVSETAGYLSALREKGLSVGFVPTMGALHPGHVSLMEQARKENDLVVCSIFVNPTQFTEQSDLVNYPRTLDADRAMAEKAGCDVLFVPSVREMYPEEKPELMDIDFGFLETTMEGTFRKGHFKGVATIVEKLFRAVMPDRAYFGEKDFQQLAVIRELVRRCSLPIEVVACPTVREPDGLAMSSRNTRLSPEERRESSALSRVLFEAQRLARTHSLQEVINKSLAELNKSPLLQVEYFEVVDADTLQPVSDRSQSTSLRACVAVKVGPVRLIDNMSI